MSQESSKTIEALLQEERTFPPPASFRENAALSDESIYERHDWRDPFIFKHPDTDRYHMLVAARTKHGPSETIVGAKIGAMSVRSEFGTEHLKPPTS